MPLSDIQIGGPVYSDQCVFKGPDGANALEVDTASGQFGQKDFDTNWVNLGFTQPLAGVGDEALWQLVAGFAPDVLARRGDVDCLLSTGGDNTQLNVAMTGKLPTSPIEPDAVDGFIKKFGALCNEVFAGS